MADFDLFNESEDTPKDAVVARPATIVPGGDLSAFETGTPPQRSATATSIAGSAVTGAFEGAAEIAGAPVDVTAWLLRKGGLDSGKAPIGGSESFKALGRKYMETVGAKPIQPVTTGEKLAESFGRGVASAAVPAVASETLLPKVAGLAPKTASTLAEIFGPRAAGVAPMAELATIGGTSGVGADVAMGLVPDKWKPTAGLAGGMVGGGLGALGVAGARSLPVLAQQAGEFFDPLSKAGVERIASRQMAKAAESPMAALDVLENEPREIVPGSKPTTFELTGDMGLGQAQRKAETMSPTAFLNRKADQNAARAQEVAKIAPSGDPADLASFFRQRSQELDTLANQYVAQAEADARRAIERTGGNKTPDEYGRVLRERLEEAKKAMRKDREALYDKVDGKVSVDVARVRSEGSKLLGEVGPIDTPLTSVEKDILEKAKSLPDQVSFKDLRGFDTYVTHEMAKERMANGESPVWRRLSLMKSAIMDSIGNAPNNAALDAAKAKHIEYSQTFKQGPVKDVLQTRGFSGQYATPDATSVAKVFPAGDKGYEAAMAFRKAAGSDKQALDAMLDYVAWSVRKEATDDKGVLDPKKFTNWQNRHREALRAFPELAGKFDSAQTAAENLAAVSEATRTVINENNTNAFKNVSGLVDPADIQRTIGGIFSSRSPVKQMRDLAAKTATDPDARNGLRRAVAEHIRDKFISNAEAGTSEQNLLRADQFQTFVKQNEAALREVFSPAEIESMSKVAADLHRANRSVRSTALPGRSTSAQDILPTIKEGGPSGLKVLLEAIAGAGGASALTTSPALGSLAIASALGHHMFEGLRLQGLRDANEIVTEALLDPDVAARLLRKIPVKPAPAGGLVKDLARVPAYSAIRSNYAKGGKVTGAMTADMLIKAAERSKKKIQSQSEHILDVPDEHVAGALRAASQHI